MKLDLALAVLWTSASLFTCRGQPNMLETNHVTALESTDSNVTNVPSAQSHNVKKIEAAIARAPEMILSEGGGICDYIDETCKAISRLPDVKTRYRYYRAFIESACATRFEKIDDMVPVENSKQVSSFDYHGRKNKIAGLQSSALRRLERLADDIWLYLFTVEPEQAPGDLLFYPRFLAIEKIKSEEKRRGLQPMSLCGRAIKRVESDFIFMYLAHSRRGHDPQDRAEVEARFKQVVGRPIRSAEKYKADARRRTEENIKEHQKQQEANRRALEFQKKYNREHNINVE